MVGLDKWNLAERRGLLKRIALPRIDELLAKRNFLLKEEQLEFVVVAADAKSAQGDHGEVFPALRRASLDLIRYFFPRL